MPTIIISDIGNITKESITPRSNTLVDFLWSEYKGTIGDNTKFFSDSPSGEEIDLERHVGDGFPLKEDSIVWIITRPLGNKNGKFEFMVDVPIAVMRFGNKVGFEFDLSKYEDKPTFPPYFPPAEDDAATGTKGVSRSNNNSLSGQTNVARTGQRIPETFGVIKSYPDLINMPLVRYDSGIQSIEQYFIASDNVLASDPFSDPYFGETLLPDYATILPAAANMEYNNYVEANKEGDQKFGPPDAMGDAMYFPMATEVSGTMSSLGNDVLITDDLSATLNKHGSRALIALREVKNGDKITLDGTLIDGTYTVKAIVIHGFEHNAAGTLLNNTSITLTFEESVSFTSFQTRDFYIRGSSISGSHIYDSDADDYDIVSETKVVVPYPLKSEAVTQSALVNVINRAGVTYGVPDTAIAGTSRAGQAVETDATVSVFVNDLLNTTITSPSEDKNFYGDWGHTIEDGLTSTPSAGFDVRIEVYRVKLLRKVYNYYYAAGAGTGATTAYYPIPINNQNNWVDDTKIAQVGIYTTETLTANVRDGKKVIRLDIATPTSQNIQPTDVLNGTFYRSIVNLSDDPDNPYENTGTPAPPQDTFPSAPAQSKMFYDAFITHAHYAGVPMEDIDFQSLIDIKNSTEVGDQQELEFSFTFSANDTSTDEELGVICRAARCELVKEGNLYRVFRDEERVEAAKFSGRNVVSYSETINFFNEDDYDGVELEYVSPTDDKQAVTRFPVSSTNPQIIRTAGIRNEEQAKRMAQFRWNEQVYRNKVLDVELTQEAQLLDIFDVIDVEDLLSGNNDLSTDDAATYHAEVVDFTPNFYAANQHKMLLSSRVKGLASTNLINVRMLISDVKDAATIDGWSSDPDAEIMNPDSQGYGDEIRFVHNDSIVFDAVTVQQNSRNFETNQVGIRCRLSKSGGSVSQIYHKKWMIIDKKPTKSNTVMVKCVNYNTNIYSYAPY